MPTVSGLSRSEASDRAVSADRLKYGYLDQTGDIKFEANLEYRFPILGDLHGATFLDAGNVWLLRYDKSRPGGQLKWGRFLKDLALGTGIGLRYDLTFLVIRLDWGIGLHVPYDTGKKGYYNIPDFKDGMASIWQSVIRSKETVSDMLAASRTALGVSRQFLLRGTPSPILNNRIRLQTGCYIIDYVQA